MFFVMILLFLSCFLFVPSFWLLKHFLSLYWQATFRGMLEGALCHPACLVILAWFCWSFDRVDLFQQIFQRLFDFFLLFNRLTGHCWLLEYGRDRESRLSQNWRLRVYYELLGVARIVASLRPIHGRVRSRDRLRVVMKHGCRWVRGRSNHLCRRVRRRSRHHLMTLVVVELAGVPLLALISISARLFKVCSWHFSNLSIN